MKYLVLSDSHGFFADKNKILALVDQVDEVIHLGDYAKDIEALNLGLKPYHVVAGNCDIKGEYPDEIILLDEGHKILLTHGHRYDVKYHLNKLYYKALSLDADIVMYGHTHVPMSTKVENLYIINPGSVSLPRGGSKNKCAIVTVAQEKVDIEYILL